MFLDRDHHLEKLNKLYGDNHFHCTNLYADSGMGKSSLLRQFCSQRRTLYFKPLETTEKENFQAFKEEVIRVLGPDEKLLKARRFADILRYIGKSAREERIIFIIDDYPHMIHNNRRLSTLLQSYVKKEWTTSLLFLVLCKPSFYFEKESGQPCDSVLLRPFTFFETTQLFPQMSVQEQIYLYGITGGIPGYFKHFLNTSSFFENLYNLYFTEEGAFYRLPDRYLKNRFPEPALIHSALLGLASERKKLHEICERTDLTPSAAGSLLTTLQSKGLVEKIIPVTEEEGSRRTMYRIGDGVFRFWYTFAVNCRSRIELGYSREAFEEEITPKLDSYFNATFEDICRQYLDLLKVTGKAPFDYSRTGSWWGQHPTRKRTEYVPIAAADENNMLLGACFFTDEWIDLNGLFALQKHATLFPHSTKWYFLFAKSDFVSGMETIYGDTVKVFTLEQMCSYADSIFMHI